MSTMPTCALPNELLEAILLELPATSVSKESVRTLCRFGQASSRFLALSRSSHIWHSHYLVRWNRCNPGHEEMRKATSSGDWWQMYAARTQLDRKALDLLDSVTKLQGSREVVANELASFGYDAWQVISCQTTKVCHWAIADRQTQRTIDVPVHGLTLQYWAREVLGVISRVRAIGIWKELIHDPEDKGLFEQGLAALSAFFGADIDAIFEELDRLAESCHSHLMNVGLSDSTRQVDLVIAICGWMRQQGFVKSDLVNFHNLLNHFPHAVLFGQPRTLPISLVYVFVCIARRLGMNALPVAFPHRVLAVVLPPTDQPAERIYVDVFESATHPILSFSEDLPTMLLQLGLDPVTLPRQTVPAATSTMVLRAASNIIQSLDRPMAWHEGDQAAGHYAAYCAALLLTGDQRLVPALFVDGIAGPLDHSVVFNGTLEKHLPQPAQHELKLHLASIKLEETESSIPKNASRCDILYFTGMVFRHKKYGYIGLIKGWDYQCKASGEWIRRMKVGDLPRGAVQPFYRSFTPDGHTRYVAEDNVEPILQPTPSDIRSLLDGNRTLGRWFDGFDLASGRFILSPESLFLYPSDDAYGREFISTRIGGQ